MEFETAKKFLKDVTNKLTNEQKLKFYALYKQSTVGNCNTERPTGFFSWERKSMWDAWNDLEIKNIKEPQKMYVAYLDGIFPDWRE